MNVIGFTVVFNGSNVFLRMRTNQKLNMLMAATCDRYGLRTNDVIFAFPNGDVIDGSKSSEELGLANDTVITMMRINSTEPLQRPESIAKDPGATRTVIDPANIIDLNVEVGVVGQRVLIKLLRDHKLAKMMQATCERHALPLNAMVFLTPSGQEVDANKTSDDYGLQNNDIITVISKQEKKEMTTKSARHDNCVLCRTTMF